MCFIVLTTLFRARRSHAGRVVSTASAATFGSTLRAPQTFHGEPSGRECPVCGHERLVELSYAFGEQLGRYAGRLRARCELEAMAHEHGEFRVYVVEVCRGCGWNHLVLSFVLGDGVDRRAGAAREASLR